MLGKIIGACGLAILLAGCASSRTHSGVKLERANVEKIQKGKTQLPLAAAKAKVTPAGSARAAFVLPTA
jgi:hypothetical protein